MLAVRAAAAFKVGARTAGVGETIFYTWLARAEHHPRAERQPAQRRRRATRRSDRDTPRCRRLHLRRFASCGPRGGRHDCIRGLVLRGGRDRRGVARSRLLPPSITPPRLRHGRTARSIDGSCARECHQGGPLEALELLLRAGFIEHRRVNGGVAYRSVRPYRAKAVEYCFAPSSGGLCRRWDCGPDDAPCRRRAPPGIRPGDVVQQSGRWRRPEPARVLAPRDDHLPRPSRPQRASTDDPAPATLVAGCHVLGSLRGRSRRGRPCGPTSGRQRVISIVSVAKPWRLRGFCGKGGDGGDRTRAIFPSSYRGQTPTWPSW